VADLDLTLGAPAPYHLGHTLAGLRMGAGDPSLRLSEGVLSAAFVTPGGSCAIRVVQGDAELRLEAWGAGAGWLEPRLPALLGLSDDPSGFDPAHPALRRLWRRARGMRLPHLPRVFERSLAVVLLQRVTTGEALRTWRRLVTALGSDAPGPLRLRVPPGPGRILATPAHELVGLGVPPRQAETLRHLARVEGRLEAAAAGGRKRLAELLGRIPGVGPWTLQYVLGSALGDPDAVLLGDDNLPHSVGWLLAGEERGSDARMLELLEPYRGHRFRVIRLVWASGRRAPRRGPRRRLAGPRVEPARRAG
jgi:3-methyladenine DNA glycosylase/8-oxoguanine DNA glycosylase